MKQKILPRVFNMASGITAEVLLTFALMSAAFLTGFIILRLFLR